MARFRRSLSVVHRIKHVVDDNSVLGSGVSVPFIMVKGVDAPTLANTRDVESGAKVHGIFLSVSVQASAGGGAGIPNCYMAVYKSPGGNIPLINPVAIGSNADKKQVFHQEMTMFESTDNTSNPKTLFKGVIVIPKGFQRFGADDELIVVVRSTAVSFKICIQCIYKEFR